MDRREFIKKAGVGSAAAAAVAGGLVVPAWADDKDGGRAFHFAAFSKAATIGTVEHFAAMAGCGRVFEDEGEIEAGGTLVHYDNASPVPKTILASGTWEARSLQSFTLVGAWGGFAAANAIMRIKFNVVFPTPVILRATLEVPCNIPNAGLFTGRPEGFFLTIDGGAEGTFAPLTPPFGGSVYAVGDEPF